MAANFLGRVFRLGRALVSWGLGPAPSSPAVVSIPGVCVTRSLDADLHVVRPLARDVTISRNLDADLHVTRPLATDVRVHRPLPEC